MKFALLNGERIAPTPHEKGATCPFCGRNVIAFDGVFENLHWQHVGKDCRKWLEDDTLWHRSWKDSFPEDWQEPIIHRFHRFQTVDILTQNGVAIGLVSHQLERNEIRLRENFYKDCAWILDVSMCQENFFRLIDDQKMQDLQENPQKRWEIDLDSYFEFDEEDNSFENCWLKSRFPVFLDFSCCVLETEHPLRQFQSNDYVFGIVPHPHNWQTKILFLALKETIIAKLLKRRP